MSTARPAPRPLTVLARRNVTPNMLRVTLGGPGLAGFPAGQAGGYLKLRLPTGTGRPCVRTYTISAQRDGELDVDFALHADPQGHAGPATRWAIGARTGEVLEVGGPGQAKPLPPGHDFYLIAGDMTSLPAIAVNLAALPAEARGFAAIEISDAADRQDLPCPAGVEIAWLVKEPGSDPDLLARTLRGQAVPAGSLYAWVACEFAAMRALRSYLREERGLGPDRLYISSYWQAGSTEDRHREVKRADMEALAA
ncbi:siderophore-interacting protein [Croceibacterium mercuriale]|uniref:Siderophore-interacting protein n=1 Tax=Croceibacterium mercuriale TaxID=1572751 RepID=A0A0B2BVK7_9SPHN|nr:siderophore-interacting protein [Croceibacterium mercuriale]KHL25653.1 siderophore-interacting protein [Croceibacterium mercuriale]